MLEVWEPLQQSLSETWESCCLSGMAMLGLTGRGADCSGCSVLWSFWLGLAPGCGLHLVLEGGDVCRDSSAWGIGTWSPIPKALAPCSIANVACCLSTNR